MPATTPAPTGSFQTLSRLCADAVDEGVVPGLVVLVADEGRARFRGAFGQRQLEPEPLPASIDTVYDVASLTKAVVTSVLAMQAVARGEIDLEDPVARHVPEFAGEGKDAVTVRHLLAHASGLPAHRPFYATLGSAPSVRLAIALAAAQEPLTHPPGTKSVYSDLGFIVLGWLLERAAGARLDAQAESGIFQPLGLTSSTFVNLADPDARAQLLADRAVAATQHCPIRGRVLVGEVDDMNAHAMGGVAGHAGLFSTADDLSRIVAGLVQAWRGTGHEARKVETVPKGERVSHNQDGPKLDGAIGDGATAHRSLVDRDIVRAFWRSAGVPGSTWRLGWDGPSFAASQAGNRLPKTAVGHLGFTGCSLWIDPERARWIVTLTNRVHPVVRDDQRFRAFRPAVQDAAVAALESAPGSDAAAPTATAEG